MNRQLATTLGGAAALIAGGLSHETSAAQAVLALCPVGYSVEATHRLVIDATGKAPAELVITAANKPFPSECRTSTPLPFSTDAVRWLGALPGEGVTSDRLAITTRVRSGEILGIEEEKLLPPQPPRHQPSRHPIKGAALPKSPAAWIWEPRTWRDDPSALVDTAKRTGVGAFYISVPIAADTVQEPGALADFILQCRKAGIEVYAVEGDPNMVTRDGLSHATDRARALAHYRAMHPDAALAGVQYDIEPYLLASFGAAPKHGWQRWSTVLRTLSDTLGEPVDAVIPFWIESSPGGADALAAIRPSLRSITIMAYRTEPEQILEAAAPVLIFAERAGLPATVGLEAGPIAQESRSIYRRARTGDLHIAALGDISAALLLDSQQAAAETHAYVKSHSVPADPSRVSFLGRLSRLHEVAGTLSNALTAYPAAQRIAFHGLSTFESPHKPSQGQ